MRPFRFRYERLFALARQQRRQAALALASRLQAEAAAEGSLSTAAARQRAAAQSCHEQLRRGVPGWLLAAGHRHRADLTAQTEAADKALARAREEVEAGRRLYRERHRQEEVYRRLRRRAWERHEQEERRRQQRLADEAFRWRGNGLF